MGAKKWSTILQENYIKTGRLFNNYSLEKEIEYYSKAGFSSPEELIEWAYFTHDTLKYFFNLYFYTVPNTKTLASIVKEVLDSKITNQTLFNFLSYKYFKTLEDYDKPETEPFETFKTFCKLDRKTNKSPIIDFLWLESNILSLSRKWFTSGDISDLICFLVSKDMKPIVNLRANLRLLSWSGKNGQEFNKLKIPVT